MQLIRFLRAAADMACQRFAYGQLALFRPQLAGVPASLPSESSSLFDTALWFAVPKQRVTRHKKRLKTTVQKRIPLRKDIVVDPRTGEVTLKHKLPFNWKDYLPKV